MTVGDEATVLHLGHPPNPERYHPEGPFRVANCRERRPRNSLFLQLAIRCAGTASFRSHPNFRTWRIPAYAGLFTDWRGP
jgi:hypothetical protein